MKTAAVVAATLLGVVTVFQIALALGAPWGAAAWGGRHRAILPIRLRVASGVAGLILYPLMIYAVLVAGEVVAADWLPTAGDFAVWIFDVGRPLMWALAGFFALGLLPTSPPGRSWNGSGARSRWRSRCVAWSSLWADDPDQVTSSGVSRILTRISSATP